MSKMNLFRTKKGKSWSETFAVCIVICENGHEQIRQMPKRKKTRVTWCEKCRKPVKLTKK